MLDRYGLLVLGYSGSDPAIRAALTQREPRYGLFWQTRTSLTRQSAEMVQMGILDPKFAVLDETDSGLDIDALRIVGAGINAIMRAPDKAVLLITHYQRLLDYVEPDFVHVLADGRIVRSGGKELAQQLESEGYVGIAA